MRQQLQVKKKNIPTNASQVCSSITSTLNESKDTVCRRDTLACNNPDVNLLESNKVERKTYVFVLNTKGQAIMPTVPSKARRLVKKGLAKVVKAYPFFVIQMLVKTRDVKQPIVLGIDSGYQNIGFSAVSSKKEFLCGTVVLDGKTKGRLDDRRMYRRNRRSRHHWYRAVRFDNRKKTKGWLPPSIERRYQTHLSLIKRIKALLPISDVAVETANFDIQKINNAAISGKEYQQGVQLGFDNVKQYVLTRDKRTCQHCGATDTKLEVHHIKFRSNGGTNTPFNLITLCSTCHKALHSGKIELTTKVKDFKPNTFMSIIHKRFWEDIPEMSETFGYITKANRLALGLDKTHFNDAFCIANGSTQCRVQPITLQQKHRNNRCLQRTHKGFKPSVRRQRYSIQPHDLVVIQNKRYNAVSMRHKKYVVVIVNNKQKDYQQKFVTKHFAFGSLYIGVCNSSQS